MQTAKMVRKSNSPTLVVFHLESLYELENLLDQDEQSLIHRIQQKAFERFLKSLQAFFEPSEISGQIIRTNVDISSTNNSDLVVEDHSYQIQNKQSYSSANLVQVQQKSINLAQKTGLNLDDYNRQIYYWFPVVLAIVLAYVIYNLFYMELPEDTLLYAKFLALEGR
eukprot:TRINITY_DN5928_c0_g1_i1.p2 TRINITY_DN5928_c0_g1~~TRINITY_DN5928_c0_g1_i1.p2  ORF type:complete len:167 (-),score=20.23 TRINITY_DN5928_c0_g1_i1:145-645(-)